MIPARGLRVIAGTLLFVALFPGGKAQAATHTSGGQRPDQASERRQVNIPIADFRLTDQAGKTFQWHSLRGKVVLATFVYSSCPDVCPLLMSKMLLVQRSLQTKERDSVFLLAITTDPEIDGPEILKGYAGRYGVDLSNWSLLTGKAQELAPVWKSFGVQVQRKARGLVSHTPLIAVVDRKGTMRFGYYGPSPDQRRIIEDTRALLASR